MTNEAGVTEGTGLEGTGLESAAPLAEPVESTAPEPTAPAEPLSREALFAETRNEAYRAALSEGDGDPSIADLREFYGAAAQGLSDAQLLQDFRSSLQPGSAPDEPVPGAVPAAAPAEPGTQEAAATVKRAFELLNGEGEPLTPDQLSVLDDIKIKYRAADADAIEELGEIVRKAQRTPYVDRRIGEVIKQRNEAAQDLVEMRNQLSSMEAERKTWYRALHDRTGDTFRELQDTFQQALVDGSGETAPSSAAPALTPEQAEQQGTLFYEQQIKPELARLAHEHAPEEAAAGPLQTQLEDAFGKLLTQEGSYLQTRGADYTLDRIREILRNDLPLALRQSGFDKVRDVSSPGEQPDAVAAELETVKAEVRALKARLGQQKLATAPDGGGGGGGVPPATSNRANAALDKAQSWHDMKDLIDNGELARALDS